VEKIIISPADSPDLIFEQMLSNNRIYQKSAANSGDISTKIRQATAHDGQKPYAVVITCADSRVVPEHIFGAGIGELFVVRSAGNTVGSEALGSVEYAVEHLGVRLIIVLAHTQCGAVAAATQPSNNETGALSELISHIRDNITDTDQAVQQNLTSEVQNLRQNPEIARRQDSEQILLRGAIYNIATGAVEAIADSPSN
jgi:carbonic anhydrase